MHEPNNNSAWSNEQGTRVLIVSQHREVAVGTLRSILRQAGLNSDEIEAL